MERKVWEELEGGRGDWEGENPVVGKEEKRG